MYVIAIGWLFVALLMAITETSVLAGLLTLFFWGLLPTGLLFYFGGAGTRRRRRLLADQHPRRGDGSDTKPDE